MMTLQLTDELRLKLDEVENDIEKLLENKAVNQYQLNDFFKLRDSLKIVIHKLETLY